MKNKILTITIPAYNVEMYIEKTLSTILDDRIIGDIEVLVINDGSKDRTAEIVEVFEKKYTETVRLINKENGGHGSTINKGLEAAVGKYFKVIDGDDWVNTEALVSFVNKLKVVDCDVVVCPYNIVEEGTEKVTKIHYNEFVINKEADLGEVIERLGDGYAMHSVTYKTECIQNKIRMDEHCFYVDMEYIIYSLSYVESVVFFDDIVYQYRVGNVNQSINIVNMQKNREMHRKVVFSLIEDYFSNYDIRTKSINKYIERKIQGLVKIQLKIYASINTETACVEYMEFWEQFRIQGNSVYKNLRGVKGCVMKAMPMVWYKILGWKLQLVGDKI